MACFTGVWERESNKTCFLRVGLGPVRSVLAGCNAGVIAFGQSGTGKTYTIGEAARLCTPSEGLLPRMLRALFAQAALSAEYSYEMRIQVGTARCTACERGAALLASAALRGSHARCGDAPCARVRASACMRECARRFAVGASSDRAWRRLRVRT